MGDKMGQAQPKAWEVSLRRMQNVLLTAQHNPETSKIMAECINMVQLFRVISMTHSDLLLKKSQEVKVLQKEKQLLENKLEQLACMVSEKTTILRDASSVDLTTLIKPEEQMKNQGKFRDGHLHLSLHLNCEEELVKRELELAKLREVYTDLTFDLQACRKEVVRMEIRLKNAEIQVATKEKERLELVKTHTADIADLKMEVALLKEEAIQKRKEAGTLEEQLGKASLKNEQFVELLKKDSKQQDELRRQQKSLKGYLQLLASKFTSTQESEDMQFELRGLECRGLDDDITSYLKTILEKSFKPAKSSLGTQTVPNGMKCSTDEPLLEEEPLRGDVRDKCLSHAGTKRSIEVINLGSDSEDEGEEHQDCSRQKSVFHSIHRRS